MKNIHFLFLLIFISFIACKKDSSSSSSTTTSSTGSTTTPGVKCDTSVLASGISGGCTVAMITPAMCATLDLTNGQKAEFGWETGGVNCETPWKFVIAGNPATNDNLYYWDLSTNYNTGLITRSGGIFYVKASDLEGLTTDNGLYHWVVYSFYGSHPASRTFKVKK